MAGKENSAMTILMDFAKPCKGKLISSVVLAVWGALCGMIPYIAVSRGIIMICHEDYAFSKLAFLALIALAGYLGQVWFGTFSTMKSLYHSAEYPHGDNREALPCPHGNDP